MDNVEGLPLSPELIRSWIPEVLRHSGKPMKREALIQAVNTSHTSAGGLPSETLNPEQQFGKALGDLRQSGAVESAGNGYWRLNPSGFVAMPIEVELEEEAALDAEVIVGNGAETIYGWYFPAYRALAELKGESRFPVKVGRTIRNPLQRIKESGGMAPEIPVLGFVARVDDAGNWERWIHAELCFFDLKIEAAVGSEWYRTSPEELGNLVSAKLAAIEAAQ